MSYFFYCIFVFGGFLKGVTAEIQTQPKVFTKTGEDAHLSCQILETKEVLQVTWQRLFSHVLKNIGSYDKHFGETVNPEFVNKVQFLEAGLQKNSIVIMNVTEEDEGCYFCLFNTYTDSSLWGQTCLHVYELHEPVLHVREASSPEESVVWCSATGGPAPTVTLTVPQQHLHFSQCNTTRVTNSNNTVTVTTTAVLSGLHDDSTQVGCATRVDSGPQMEVVKRISELKQTSDDDLKNTSGSYDRGLSWPLTVVCVVVAACCVGAVFGAVFCVCHRKKKTSISKLQPDDRSEEITSKDTQRSDEPLIPDPDLRQRSRQNSDPQSSS